MSDAGEEKLTDEQREAKEKAEKEKEEAEQAGTVLPSHLTLSPNP